MFKNVLILAKLHIALTIICTYLCHGAAILNDTPLDTIVVNEGEEALLDCVVRNIGNYTVLWRYTQKDTNSSQLLTAGLVKIVTDNRFSLHHKSDDDTWILSINPVRKNDTGRYICEVNTSPKLQINRILVVSTETKSNTQMLTKHNFTDCCIRSRVPASCLEFCSLNSILGGNHPNPWQCMDHLPAITRCLTDGRNHLPCCVRQNIPEECRPVCIGSYGLSTVLQHYTCMEHTLPTLACIAEGIELLPGPPKELTILPLSSSQLKVFWKLPHQNINISYFKMNVTQLYMLNNEGYFMQDDIFIDNNSTALSTMKQFTFKIPSRETSYTVNNLLPLTMYEVQMVSVNEHGTSLPTYASRAITFSNNDTNKIIPQTTVPHLPDVIGCCEQRGVPLGRCLRTLCDPTRAEQTRLTDIMVCAPWANVTFECMAGGVDHSECCQRRGLPEVCMDFCHGNISRIDYRHFICLEYMSVYSNCLLEHYGILPGPPEDFAVASIHAHWAILKWETPRTLAHTITSYALYWKEVSSDFDYNVIPDVRSPTVLDKLQPATRYDVYVVAKNKYGTSQNSVHAVFMTRPLPSEKDFEVNNESAYNVTACCISAKLRSSCLPLCTYNVKMSDLEFLALTCANQMDVLIRCGAGGRNHIPCCQRRGVKWDCLTLCEGVLESPPHIVAPTCLVDIGKIVQCMREGADILPGPPEELHTTVVNSTGIQIQWSAPSENAATITSYEVRYTEIEDKYPPNPLYYSDTLNVSGTETELENLKPNTYYSIYVIAINEFGNSLPSLVLVVQTPSSGSNNTTIISGLSPPHSLEVTHQTTDSITVAWRPPLHIPPDAFLTYIVYYQAANISDNLENSTTTAATSFTSILITNLTLNTQYAIAVKARGGSEESHLSEMIFAWTDPAIPAFLNPPVIISPEPLLEGNNVTVLCVATGIPIPTVSIFLNGQLQVEQQQSHVALVTPHIYRNASKVDCYADNGYGEGAQSSLKLSVNFKPEIETIASSTINAEEGQSVRLQCIVSSNPKPQITWYRDLSQQKPIKKAPNFEIQLSPHHEEMYTYVASLAIPKVTKQEEGQYLCVAENQFGNAKFPMKLKLSRYFNQSIMECCKEKNVQRECQDACERGLAIEEIMNRPHCLKDLDKLMNCAADERDHRPCCRERGIAHSCLKWCKGRPVFNINMCVLSAAKDIVSCFEEGKAVLPGPPYNVVTKQISRTSLRITWEKPLKNPQMVQWYRVFWRPVGTRNTFRNQTKKSLFTLKNLKPETTYEVALKAGNRYGLSTHTKPIVFTMRNSKYIKERLVDGNGSTVKIAIGAIVGVLLLVLSGAVAVYLYIKFNGKPRTPATVSFENPTYMKETIPNNSQPSTERNGISTGNVG
ncbi:Ig-like and fibronectin type-III domain-containing protein 1 [Centruroides vittatus]|uniref:Ig-like and fibronectin type-III domain-containing protein 1 n=1 Tax=Centruroides vittatus TaxID=120091 RepID=UPI00350FD5AA